MNYKQQVIDFFNGRTAYDDEGRGHPENAQRLLDLVNTQPNQTVLDLCTGTGLIVIPVAKAVMPSGRVIGVDMSSGMLSQARTKIQVEGIKNIYGLQINVRGF